MAKKGKFKPKGGEGRGGGGASKDKEKKLNPFEVHMNRIKYDVVGRKSKNDRGLPGVSRAKAIKKRERTLLQEYKVRHKSNVFIDRRIGENNATMDPEKKMLLRLAAVKKKQFSKKSLFNLNDEELTHGGVALTEGNFNDASAFSDDDDDMLDAQFVKDTHFGGDFLTKRKEEDESTKKDDDKPKSRKEWIEEIIAESKKKKAESKKEKEEQEEAVSKLNDDYQKFMSIMVGHAMTDADKEKSKKDGEFRDYDSLVRELGLERTGKAKAVNKMKTPEEIAKEKKTRLMALEADRIRRMKGEDVAEVKTKGFSADDLNDSFAPVEDNRFHVSYKDGKMLGHSTEEVGLQPDTGDTQSEESEDGSEIEADEDVAGEGSEKEEEDVEEEDVEEAEDSDNESDTYSDILHESSSEDEESEQVVEKNKSKSKKTSEKKRELMEAAKREIPYTFTIPQEYEAFWALIEERTPGEVNTIMERMVACHHPSLGGDNKAKCDTIFKYLLQTLHLICDTEGEIIMEGVHPMVYVDVLVPHMYEIVQLSAENSANAFMQVIEEKYADFNTRKSKRYPTADTLVFLKIAGLLFPASDYQHLVMTPLFVFMTHLLGQSQVSTQREVSAGLFVASVTLENVMASKRFIPELCNFLNGLLFISAKSKDKTKLPHQPPFKPVGPSSSLLELKEECQDYEPTKLKLTDVNEKAVEDVSEKFKVLVVHTCTKMLLKLCKCWSGLQAVRSIFNSTSVLLEALPASSYPAIVQESMSTLKEAIANLPKHLQPLAKQEGRPKALNMYEPAVETIFEGVKKRFGTKEQLERQKLLYKVKREAKGARREIQRDRAFLGRQKLQETLQSDAERKRKVNQIMSGLALQENEHKKMKKKK
ncbi:nucleolar protein 14-like isoform X2 [Oratosquilla oratoria]|uniref:nucleolar protein 14-like isoform X2 n=1 Tax=Oratosquilla oratoria TaxID=337810 RepID=UPI003F76E7D3